MTVYTEKWNGVIRRVVSGGKRYSGTEINTTIAKARIRFSVVCAIANGTNADIFFDISYIAGGTVTTTGRGLSWILPSPAAIRWQHLRRW